VQKAAISVEEGQPISIYRYTAGAGMCCWRCVTLAV